MCLPVCLPLCLIVSCFSIHPTISLSTLKSCISGSEQRVGGARIQQGVLLSPISMRFWGRKWCLITWNPCWFRLAWIAKRGLLWRPEYKETHKIIQSSHPLRQILSASASSHDHHSPVAQVSCWRASNWNLENNEMSFQETTGCTMKWTTTPHPSPREKVTWQLMDNPCKSSLCRLFPTSNQGFQEFHGGKPLTKPSQTPIKRKQLRWYQVTKRSVMWLRYNLAQLWEIDNSDILSTLTSNSWNVWLCWDDSHRVPTSII